MENFRRGAMATLAYWSCVSRFSDIPTSAFDFISMAFAEADEPEGLLGAVMRSTSWEDVRAGLGCLCGWPTDEQWASMSGPPQ
jgi:hypothetical protein